MYNQRDIVLIPFPYSDLTGAKQRPALIISNRKINDSADRICCFITSNETKEGILIRKGEFESGRLPFKSWIKPHRLFTIHERIIKRKMCTISNSLFDKTLETLQTYLKRI